MNVGQAPHSWDQTKVRMRLWWCRKYDEDDINTLISLAGSPSRLAQAGAGFCTLCLKRKWRPPRSFLISSSFHTDQPKTLKDRIIDPIVSERHAAHIHSCCHWPSLQPAAPRCRRSLGAMWNHAPMSWFVSRPKILFVQSPNKRWWKPSARFFSHRWSVSGRVSDAFWCYAAYSTVRLFWVLQEALCARLLCSSDGCLHGVWTHRWT